MVRVCIFTETYFPVVGGGETQARSLARGLHALGWQPIVLTRRSDPALASEEKIDDVMVYRLPPTGHSHMKKWGLLFTSLPALLRLHHQYDAIFVSGFRVVGITAVLAAKLLHKPIFLKADSLGEMSGDFFVDGLAKLKLKPDALVFRTFLWWRNWLLRRANAFVAISSVIRDELLANNVSTEKIVVIPNSVDTSRFMPVNTQKKLALRAQLNLPPEKTIVIYTGRLVTYKGLPLLLRVWRDIQQNCPEAYLLLVGGGGLDIHNCEAELKSYVCEHGLKSVHFTGNVDNVSDYLQASDVFVFPTENEAFGISVIEAMACGLPVVATAVGGVKDIVIHGKNGLAIQSNDYDQLYQALTHLISSREKARELSQAGQQTVQENYTETQIIKRYCQLFAEL